ncbi:MAG: aminopeptidase [bacterium]|nr:aminopeptidase [bacterium]
MTRITLRPTMIGRLALIAASLMTCGCGVDLAYLMPVVAGQVDLLLAALPVDEAISSGRLTEAQTAKLSLLREAREYAGREMGLNTVDNYTLFYDGGDGPVAYNVSASLKHRFHARKWSFPFVGVLPYLGFFDYGPAKAKLDELAAEGYDVFMYPVDAYSTLDYFPNPILSPMLNRDDISLVDTVIHELLHSTVWHASDVTFNESLATFVGRTGAVEFFAAMYPEDPGRVQAVIEHYEDTDRYNSFIFELYNELQAFYAGDASQDEKIAGREAVYQAGRERFVAEFQPLMHHPERYDWVATLPTNNAWMLGNYRYNLDLDIFAQVHEATGGGWPETLAVFRAAAAADDPAAALRAWLTDGGGETANRRISEGEPSLGLDHPVSSPSTPRGPCPRATSLIDPR